MLADGIYPQWAIFVLPNHAPLNERDGHMTQRQEGVRKDVERLQNHKARMTPVERQPADSNQSGCVILHNMIVRMTLNGELYNEQDENGVPQTATDLLQQFFNTIPLQRQWQLKLERKEGMCKIAYHTY